MSKKYKKPLTPSQIAELPDDQIDFSDIPELTASILEKMEVNIPETMGNVSVRLRKDVLEFYEGKDKKGYTTRMAAVLTAYADAHKQD